MRVFGCLCYVVNVKRQDKFLARALPAVFMGYTPTKNGYKLYDLQSKQFIVSRDVVFKEHIFPFRQMKLSHVPFFPLLEPTDISSTSDILCKDLAPDHNADHDNDAEQRNEPIPKKPDTPPGTTPVPDVDSIALDVVPQLQTESSHLQDMNDALPIAVRKHPRTTGPPKWLQDFVSTSYAYHMSDYLTYDRLSPSYVRCLSAQSSIVEPKHYHEASKYARWVAAMQQKVTALEENNT
ncbi:uncharacterized protein LOC107801308 [Nicotiana tabacum]|uniref:Uncharacterized protein LOC107801308 n=2 Tax=Nicotiana TaxID=4085 RepID=A0A1S4AUC7_TOBAC|nr:PREDICTED: uncharacterized protein LOC104223386 [Nicotiana sylvestris]XP_016480103.1 PREDICTED: uncharacterized protein LOC107801308 [Nicotiana tabacum]